MKSSPAWTTLGDAPQELACFIPEWSDVYVVGHGIFLVRPVGMLLRDKDVIGRPYHAVRGRPMAEAAAGALSL